MTVDHYGLRGNGLRNSKIGILEVVSERPRVVQGHEVRTIVGVGNLRRRVA